MGVTGFKVIITFDGTENNYSADIVAKYKHLPTLSFIGLVPYEKVTGLYSQVNCLLFPSTLESWGLPVSEFKQTGKPMIIADLPYAKETAGNYEKTIFFNPKDASQLASYMLKIIRKETIRYSPVEVINYEQPYSSNWEELFKIILK